MNPTILVTTSKNPMPAPAGRSSFLSKKMILLILSMGFLSVSMGQLVAKAKCPDFYVNLLDGTLNGLKPNRTLGEFKTLFPCSTSIEEEGTTAKCGSGIFFKTKDIYVYSKRNYIEIGPKFQGKLSLPLMGAKRNTLFSSLGNPKVKDDKWEAYEMQYGTLVLHFDALNKVRLIQFSTLGTEQLSLCE